jgi:hypothetical protein
MLFKLKNGQQLLVRGDAMMLSFFMGELNFDTEQSEDDEDDDV